MDIGEGVGLRYDEANPWIQSRLKQQPGQRPTCSFMESRMQTDFSSVNIHTGREAVHVNRELGARAFTVGNDINFNEWEYRHETTRRQNLLTHVIQQNTVANVIRRDDIKPAAAAPPKHKYIYAEKENKRYA